MYRCSPPIIEINKRCVRLTRTRSEHRRTLVELEDDEHREILERWRDSDIDEGRAQESLLATSRLVFRRRFAPRVPETHRPVAG
jgi:hypothetical protein